MARTGKTDAAVAAPGAAVSMGRYAIPFKVPGSQRDRQSLHYFCVQGAYEIGSHFNTDFWTKIVLQQSHEESVVRQALVSLSALHLEYTTTGVPGGDYTKYGALAQYGRAIKALRQRIEKPGHDTVKTALTCCILFYAFEAALGNNAAALRHLDSGLDLLSAHRHHPELENMDELNTLSHILERLDMQTSIFDDSRNPRLLHSTEALRDTAAFQSLDEASWAFIRVQNSFFNFLTTRVPYSLSWEDSLLSSVAEEKRLLQDLFDGWISRFEKSGLGKDHEKQEYIGAKILLVTWHVSIMLCEAQYPTRDSRFFALGSTQPHEILDMAQEVLDHFQRGQKGTEKDLVSQRRTFSSESGILAPLIALATKCPHEAVCKRALEMLHRSGRREGLLDAGSMAQEISQFRSAKKNNIMNSDENGARAVGLTSVEKLFQRSREINGVISGMGKLELSDGVKSEPTC